MLAHRIPRLFVEQDLDGDRLTLDEHQAHYLGHVLRLARGAELVVFNGRNVERRASVETLQRRGAVLALTAAHEPVAESPLDLTLLQALPKSDAMDLVVQKATELGARTIVPVVTEFSVVRLDAERSERRLEHWRKIARAACEQSGRHRPPHIEAPAPLATAIAALPETATRLALDPTAERSFSTAKLEGESLVVAVGPEGGFGPMDWQRLDRAAFMHVSLGRRVLRTETAAIAVCAVAQARWGDLTTSQIS